MDAQKLRAWWWHRQGLDGTLAGRSAAEVLESAGWARSVGGVGPYLTLFSRAGIGRQAADGQMARLQIHELPAARGCTYVVPASDFALALKVGQGFADESEMKVARKLGVKDAEIDALCATVVKVVAKGALTPEEIRAAAGSAVRSLGEEGRKRGLTSTLPVAIGKLQSSGELRRVPTDGRLDQQRYRYTLWKPNPLAKCTLSSEEARLELARRFFRWAGPATLSEFQAFSGLGVKAGKAAVAPLRLVELEKGSDRLMFPADRDALAAYAVPRKAQPLLLSSLDGLFLLRRDAERFLDPADARKTFFTAGRKAAGGLMDLPSHAIVDRGRVVGLWEYDPQSGSIAWTAFVTVDKALREAVARTEGYVREQLGDARSFSLDSPKSRAARIEALRRG